MRRMKREVQETKGFIMLKGLVDEFEQYKVSECRASGGSSPTTSSPDSEIPSPALATSPRKSAARPRSLAGWPPT